MLTFGSLFAGIGGFDLGFERAGMKCVFQVEKDKYASQVLCKHWPDVPRYGDITKFCRMLYDCERRTDDVVWCPRCDSDYADCECVGTHQLLDEIGCYPDLLCGGFPCQDISNARTTQGDPAGLDGERSGLWREFRRVLCELRPRWVVAENVGAVRVRGLSAVLWQLAELGYVSEWLSLPAAAVGAPHKRERVFIVAHADGEGLEGNVGPLVAREIERRQNADAARSDWFHAASRVLRSADGVSCRMDRLRCLGNAVVPQVAEVIGRAILEFESVAS